MFTGDNNEKLVSYR